MGIANTIHVARGGREREENEGRKLVGMGLEFGGARFTVPFLHLT